MARGYDVQPDQVQTYNHNTDKPDDKDGIIVELDELEKLVEKCTDGGGDIKDQERRITNWAGCRWAYVERQYPLLSMCEDFLGTVVSQLLGGKNPAEARVICWVS